MTMVTLYNRYTGAPADYGADMAAVVLGLGAYVASPGEVSGGEPPDLPPLPPLAGGGVQSGVQYSIAGAPVAASVAASDWVRVLDQASGEEKRVTRATFRAREVGENLDQRYNSLATGPSDSVPVQSLYNLDGTNGWATYWRQSDNNYRIVSRIGGVDRVVAEYRGTGGQVSLGGARGREILRLIGPAEATRRFGMAAALAGGFPALFVGSDDQVADPNVPFLVRSQGDAGFIFISSLTGRTSQTLFEIGYVANPTSWLKFSPGTADSYALGQPVGAAADISALYGSKGTGSAILGIMGGKVGFFGGFGGTKGEITGSRSTETAAVLGQLVAYLASLNLLTDGTTA